MVLPEMNEKVVIVDSRSDKLQEFSFLIVVLFSLKYALLNSPFNLLHQHGLPVLL